MPQLDLDHVRDQFPALRDDAVFLDNTGGSHVAKSAANKIADFMFTANVQVGASHETSVAAGNKVGEDVRRWPCQCKPTARKRS